MTFEELEKADTSQLREEVVRRFNQYNATSPGGIEHLWEAQFYIGEIDRRQAGLERQEDRRIALRDFRMEWAVISLIGLELVAAVWGIALGVSQGREDRVLMDKQNRILSDLQSATSTTATTMKNLETSSAATAKTLLALQSTMERMSQASQGQLALFYDVSLNIFWDAANKSLRLSNNGRTNISLVGVKFGDKQPAFVPPQVIAPNGMYTEQVSDIDEAMASLPKGTSRSFPLLLFLKNAKQEEFVVEQNIDLSWEADKVILRTQTSSIRPERWSRLRNGQATH
jgi:hypothetical protein